MYYVSNLIFDREKSIRYSRPRISVVWEKRLFKSHETIRLLWDFCRSRISAGFGKSAGFRLGPEPELKSGTALISPSLVTVPNLVAVIGRQSWANKQMEINAKR